MNQHRASSLGCLGVFSIFALILFSLIEIGALWWMNPNWFDRVALWRGPRVEPDVIFVSDPAVRQSLADADRARLTPQVLTPAAGRVELIEEATVRVDASPSREARLDHPNGASLQLPAGSLRERAQVRMTPAMLLPREMETQFVGPVYDIRIGDKDHYTFASPAELTLPYTPDMVKGDSSDATLAVWEDGKWTPVPSRIDAQRGLITGAIPHASVWGVIKGVGGAIGRRFTTPLTGPQFGGGLLVGGYWVASNGTVRGGAQAAFNYSDSINYITENFRIHYYTGGKHAVRSDSQYLLTRGRKAGSHPLYVLDLAQMLESARATLEKQGYDLPPAGRYGVGFRYHVFIIKSSSLGETPLNGPLYLASELDLEAQNGDVDPTNLMRATVVHELLHVAQGEYFYSGSTWWEAAGPAVGGAVDWARGTSAADYRYARIPLRSWAESSAAYLADKYWADAGSPSNLIPDYYLNINKTRLCSMPMDCTDEGMAYAYGRFFWWLDERYNGAGAKLVKAVNDAGPSLHNIDAACKSITKWSLADLFVEFATEFYYTDIWNSGKLYPKVHKGTRPVDQAEYQTAAGTLGRNSSKQLEFTPDPEFTRIIRKAPSSDKDPAFIAQTWAMATVPTVAHLTAHPFYVCLDDLPKKRKPKVVICVEPLDQKWPEKDFVIQLGKDRVGRNPLPRSGNAGGLAKLALDKPRIVEIVEPYELKPVPDRLTLMVFNKSLDNDIRGFDVQRWALMAPAFVQSEREPQSPSRWTVTWHRAELKDYPKAFGGYNIYRKKLDEPDSAYQLVEDRWPDEVYTHHAPDMEHYIFTVRLRDQLGNESANAPVDLNDPFLGTWDGEVTLVKGTFVKPVIQQMGKSIETRDKEKKAEFAKITDPKIKADKEREWETDKKETMALFGKIGEVLEFGEEIARVGIPMKLRFHTDPKTGHYILTMPEIVWNETGMKKEDGLAFRRVDRHTLKAVEQNPMLPPLVIKLDRAEPDAPRSEFRKDDYDIPAKDEFQGATLKWSFTREQQATGSEQD